MVSKIQHELLTAVILTWNEEENIARTLSGLQWLERIVIVDSGSTDATLTLISSFENTELHHRDFDTHANQWNYGLSLCNSEWILSLDADYILTDTFIAETKDYLNAPDISAVNANFEFCVFGKPLHGNNTTARPVLFKKKDCNYYDDGHTQRLHINGKSIFYKNKILHDDRKPLSRWLINQSAYSLKEAIMLNNTPSSRLNFTSRLRKTKVFAPLFIFFYCLFIKGLIFSGWRGWHYTMQRTMVEIIISMRLTEQQKLRYNEQKK